MSQWSGSLWISVAALVVAVISAGAAIRAGRVNRRHVRALEWDPAAAISSRCEFTQHSGADSARICGEVKNGSSASISVVTVKAVPADGVALSNPFYCSTRSQVFSGETWRIDEHVMGRIELLGITRVPTASLEVSWTDAFGNRWTQTDGQVHRREPPTRVARALHRFPLRLTRPDRATPVDDRRIARPKP